MNWWEDVVGPYLVVVAFFYLALIFAWLDARKPAYRQALDEREQRVMVWIGLAAPVWPLTVAAALVAAVVVPARWGWRLVRGQVPFVKGRH